MWELNELNTPNKRDGPAVGLGSLKRVAAVLDPTQLRDGRARAEAGARPGHQDDLCRRLVGASRGSRAGLTGWYPIGEDERQ